MQLTTTFHSSTFLLTDLAHGDECEQPARERRRADSPLLGRMPASRAIAIVAVAIRSRYIPRINYPRPPAPLDRTPWTYSAAPSVDVRRQCRRVPGQRGAVAAKTARHGRRRGGRAHVCPSLANEREGGAASGRKPRAVGVGVGVCGGVGGVGVGVGGGVGGAPYEKQRWRQREGSEARAVTRGRRVAQVQRQAGVGPARRPRRPRRRRRARPRHCARCARRRGLQGGLRGRLLAGLQAAVRKDKCGGRVCLRLLELDRPHL